VGLPWTPNRQPPIESVESLETDFQLWWSEIRLGDLKKPGKNGLLSVLACLMWWRDAIVQVQEASAHLEHSDSLPANFFHISSRDLKCWSAWQPSLNWDHGARTHLRRHENIENTVTYVLGHHFPCLKEYDHLPGLEWYLVASRLQLRIDSINCGGHATGIVGRQSSSYFKLARNHY
jgi:hypothetical protein